METEIINRVANSGLITLDLEDYYQVSAFAKGSGTDHWDGFVSRIEQNTEKLLALFDTEKRKATFFTLG